ncbi:MAG: septal ring lytic transglycosylase RlpA family protein [Terriglobia bacterium]
MIRYVVGLGMAAFVAMAPSSQAGQPAYFPYCTPTIVNARPHVGIASWYGKECQGNPTASGESYNMNGLTAAHRKLPLGTEIRVTNLKNHRSLNLRVNDRGPFVPGRLLDVSRAAARLLGFSGEGLARVRIQVLHLPRKSRVQVVCPGARLYALN